MGGMESEIRLEFCKKIWRMAEKGAGMEPRAQQLGCGALGSFTEDLQPLPVPGFRVSIIV